MKTDIANPADRPRDSKGHFKKSRGSVHKKGSGRRNPGNPTKSHKGSGKSYRSTGRRNPDGLSGSNILSGGAGGLSVRAALQKIGGDREADGTLTGTHWLVAAGSIWAAPKVAAWAGAGHDAQTAFQGGVSGVVASLVADEKAPDIAKAHLFPMTKEGAPRRAPATTSTVTPAAGTAGLGATQDRPLSRDQYLALAGTGQLPPGGAYVEYPDRSVYFHPGTAGVGAGPSVDLPPNARPGMILRDTDTHQRVRLELRGSQLVAVPIPGNGTAGVGATKDQYLTAAFQS